MAAIRFMLVIFCLGFTGRIDQPHRDLLAGQHSPGQDDLIRIAFSQVGVKELKNKNDGKEVEAYLKVVGLARGQPWCAAFICWVYRQAGYSKPRSGWSPDLFNTKVNRKTPAPGLVIGIYFPELHRIAHAGFISTAHGSWLQTIEGNTNNGNSREGDGVYAKRRNSHLSYTFSDWLPREGGEP
jgi:hypothetical protein